MYAFTGMYIHMKYVGRRVTNKKNMVEPINMYVIRLRYSKGYPRLVVSVDQIDKYFFTFAKTQLCDQK
jgi:hypothetical protein